ncbi:M48 family metallopeptidase [Aureimonas fodinaquatilis]|uniref:M48 family metallopeptidase n=1 Tax=Aureimonas fodinaquatilis TaxID=2565783 RepID=A0A5B0DTJ4_9HYPH|nr:SprT family zinc-dependent metalloprotease [Aureimonas fodinaquatilis]KAA0968499.1 M48 family metallopeptidase [Aureimonas fodinaquatilis]
MNGFLPAFLTRHLPSREKYPKNLLISGQNVPVDFREHPTAKRLILKITSTGTVAVTIPRRTARKTVLAFLDRHQDWVNQRLAERQDVPQVAHGGVLPFRGKRLEILHEPGLRATRLENCEAGHFRLHVGGEAMHLPRRVKDFLVREARKQLQSSVDRHSQAVGMRPASMTLKDTTTRWGSCTHARGLSFSFRIIMAPPAVLDYLAAHEVAHFVEMNHSPRFWALCHQLCPQTDSAMAWLKTNGQQLQAIRF